MIGPFEFVNNRRVLYGADRIDEIGGILKWYQKKKVFFNVFDKNAPQAQRIASQLEAEGIGYVLYDQVTTEPDLEMINGGRDLYIAEGCDCSIALGGGSVIDVTKAIGMLAVNGGNVEEYQMEGRQVTTVPPLFIAVPTTSGTGAEATKTAVVLNNHNGLKKSLYHTTMIADIVILDPTLTTALPRPITVATGMDALSHAVESYVSLNASPFSEMYGAASIELIDRYLATACAQPEDLEARGGMMLASYLGGCAITAGIGIAHIMAQPLGAMFHIPHGDACSIFLPVAMDLNLDYATARYAKIAQFLHTYDGAKSDRENGLAAIEKVKALRAQVGAPDHLAPYIQEEPTESVLLDTIKRTTGHITCNPNPLSEELMLQAYAMAR